MAWKTLDDMELDGKRVLTRVDINVPVENGEVTDATRIERVGPTVQDILSRGGKPVLLARRIIATAIRLMLQQAPLRSGPALSAETRRRLERLTPRERQVATLVCEGLPNKVIAAQLGISQKTVEVHRANVMSKTGASSLGGLIHMMLGITPSTLSI